MRGLLGWLPLGQPLLTFRDIVECFFMRAVIGVLRDKVLKALQRRPIMTVSEIEMTYIKFMLGEVGETPLDMVLGLQGILIIREFPP